MAWFAAALPYISTAVTTTAAVAQTINARNRERYNAKVRELEAKTATDQALREEEGLRRGSRLFLGRQAAAIAQAGIGSGGTAGLLADQSGALAELDALNVRYGGQLRPGGLIAAAESSASRARGTGLLAGGQLLVGATDIYDRARRPRG
jgi:hypothetical protein